MSNGMLPSYLSMAKPNPAENRAPWYKGTAPVYAGIFLWVVFYMEIAKGTLSQSGLGLCLLGLVIAALICHFLFYLVPGLFGMQTGYPLYVVGSSTYGTKGGFLMPGLLMGLLQFGWLAVNTAIATDFILQAFGKPPAVNAATGEFSGGAVFTIVAIIWAAVAVFMAIKGIQYIGKVSTYLPIVPLVMILIVFFSNVGTAGKYTPAADGQPLIGFLTIIAIVVSIFLLAIFEKVFQSLFMGPKIHDVEEAPKTMLIGMGILTVVVIFFGLFPEWAIDSIVQPAAQALADQAAYIGAVLGGG